MSRARGRRRQAGFTLLEVLVALVVLGLIMVGLSQGVQFGLRAWGVQTRLIAQHADLDAVDRALRRLIEQMDPGSYAEVPAAKGSATEFDFVTDLPMAAGALSTRHADVSLLVDGGHRLLLRWRPHAHVTLLGPPSALQETELLSGVDHIDIAYWRGAPGGGGSWLAAWATSRNLPGLVRIKVVFPSGDKRHWPDLVAAPLRERPEG